jgi:hydrogenase maturation protein HypF
MKLESAALKGKDVLRLKPIIKNEILETTPLIQEIFEKRNKYTKRDLAYSAHIYLAEGLSRLAIQQAKEKDVDTIGFSGGVAYNEILVKAMRKTIETAGMRFLVHERVPPGDGGLSFGQAVASGFFRL